MIEVPETRDLFFPVRHERRVGEAEGWCIGRDLGAEIWVLDDGRIIAAGEDGSLLVNSSLEQYVESLSLVGALRDSLLCDPDDDAGIVECESALQDLDEAAYSAGEYWALIMEQIRDEQF